MLEITYLNTCNICHEDFTNDKIIPCKRCTCKICKNCYNLYTINFGNSKCPQCGLKYKKLKFKYSIFIPISVIIYIMLCYGIGLGITKNLNNDFIAFNFIIGLMISVLIFAFLVCNYSIFLDH